MVVFGIRPVLIVLQEFRFHPFNSTPACGPTSTQMLELVHPLAHRTLPVAAKARPRGRARPACANARASLPPGRDDSMTGASSRQAPRLRDRPPVPIDGSGQAIQLLPGKRAGAALGDAASLDGVCHLGGDATRRASPSESAAQCELWSI